ncbi:MAG: PBP1A family penicillin-binding protein [Burkholderiaceae bacterium]|nr:PBP1A family penicillin-binding protein [Roseateles sp.]MBV8471339.1 PBP1A family penicillin-binding protein [Burkholderiaceae bacterium]
MRVLTHPASVKQTSPLATARAQAGMVMPGVLTLVAGALAVVVLLLAVAAALVYPTLPSLDNLTDYQPKQPLRIYTTDNQLIAEFGAERRHYLPLAQIPKRMQDALLAIEDTNFYEHGGVSYTGILRAIFSNLVSARSQGASTITQQLARDLYLTKKKLYSRKFIEILLANKIESQLSKEKILEVYMNQIYLGQKAYGFEAAAEIYFGKPLKELSIAETAMLAGLPQNPAYANPISNLPRAQHRQLVVLERMRDTKLITAEEYEAAKNERLHIRSPQDQLLHGEYAAEMVRQVVYAQYGEDSYTRGLKVYTTLVADQQIAAYKGLRKTLMDFERRKPYRGPEGRIELGEDEDENDSAIEQALSEHPDNDELHTAIVTQVAPGKVLATLQNGDDIAITSEGLRNVQSALSDRAKPELRIQRGSIIRVARGTPSKAEPLGVWVVAQSPEAEGAFIAMEPATGQVRALVGGFDFARNKFNHVTQAWRQPGSSFKPILYSAALELGITPDTLVNNGPISIGGWEPKNAENDAAPEMTLKQALAHSMNLVSVRVMQQVTPARAKTWAGQFGLSVDKQPDNLTLALGSGSVTPMQMASAYSVFANGGYLVQPLLISKIVDDKGATLVSTTPTPLDDTKRAISERNTFVMSTMLNEVTRSGTAARAQGQLKRPDLYGKTGTTNDSVDAWFAGFQPSVTAVVWIGYDNNKSLGDKEFGGGVALPAWIDFMNVALRNVPVTEIQPPAEGVMRQGDNWVFDEFAGEAGTRRLGFGDTVAEPLAPAASAP